MPPAMTADHLRPIDPVKINGRGAHPLRELRKNLFDLRFQSATDRLETPSEMRKARREIARILTIQRERALKSPAK